MKSFFGGFREELLKLAFHEGWGLGGEWSSYSGSPNADMGPLLSEQGKPPDVDYKNARADYFHSLIGQPPDERNDTKTDGKSMTEGKAGEKGKLGNADGQRR